MASPGTAGNTRKQLTILAVVAAIFLGVMGFVFKDQILPTAAPGALVAAPRSLPMAIDGRVFDRGDFKELKAFGDIPVKVIQDQKFDPFRVE
ncbi:MAG: hypothetical protein AAB692_00080 [Patescibacteria group bacterium]